MAFVRPLKTVTKVWAWALSNSIQFAIFSILRDPLFPETTVQHLTPSQLADARLLPTAILWCSAEGAAAAVLALLLAGHRRSRLALAYVALAAAVANHCVAGRVFCLLIVNTQGHIILIILAVTGVIYFAVWDLLGFLTLLQAGDDQQQVSSASCSTAMDLLLIL